MTRKTQKLFAALAAIAVYGVASYALAQTPCDPNSTVCNPVKFPDIAKFIAGFLRVVVMVALPIISLFIVYAGFLFVKARGNPGDLETAKKNFLYVIIGAILILGAWVISTLIAGTVSQITTGAL